MTHTLFDYADARQARNAALDLLEATRKPWIEQARDIARKLYAETGRPVSVDDVRAILPPDPTVDPRVMGAIFRRPEWVACEWSNSERVTCHGRPIRRFVRAGQ